MSGAGEGKIRLEANVYVDGKEITDLQVYIHLKGYSNARVTHLDIESMGLDNLISGKGEYMKVIGIEEGISIIMPKKAEVREIQIKEPELIEILDKGEEIYTWIGNKSGGIFIGFKKEQIRKLEHLAEKIYGMTPI